MENKDLIGDSKQHEQLVDVIESHSQPPKEAGAGANPLLRRENDSLDDFEHLEHDVSPVKDAITASLVDDAKDDVTSIGGVSLQTSPPRAVTEEINTVASESAAETATKLASQLHSADSDNNTTTKSASDSLIDSAVSNNTMSSVSDMLDLGGDAAPAKSDLTTSKTPTSNVTDLLGDLTSSHAPPPVPPHTTVEDVSKKAFGDFDNFKSATQNFMDSERGEEFAMPAKLTSTNISDLADRFSDSEPETDDFKPSSNEDFPSKPDADKSGDFPSKAGDYLSKTESTSNKTETFKDVIEEPEPVLPKRDYAVKEPSPIKEVQKLELEPVRIETVTAPEPKPVTITTTAPVKSEPEPKPIVEKVCELPTVKTGEKKEVIAAEAMFCKMGLGELYDNNCLYLFINILFSESVCVCC